MNLELPWPPAQLSPNASHAGNWWVKRSAASAYRMLCVGELKLQSVPRLFVGDPIMLDLTFCPPTRRRFDLDNALSKAKQGIDALAELMGVDDQIFEYTLRRGEPVKGGKIIIQFVHPAMRLVA